MHTLSITCPSCGAIQEPGSECRRCGIIFQKYWAWKAQQVKHAIDRSAITFDDPLKKSSQVMLLLVLVIILAALLHHLWENRAITHPPGVLVHSEPEQVIIEHPKPWLAGERLFVPLAHFRVQARVLSKERYRFDRMADISPVDLALGWGPMSDQAVLDRIDIGQGFRRFTVSPVDCTSPLPLGLLMAHSSNMHMIPATDDIRQELCALRAGQIVEVHGRLVGVQESGQWTWVSSLSRTDTGDGACEIIWVEQLSVR